MAASAATPRPVLDLYAFRKTISASTVGCFLSAESAYRHIAYHGLMPSSARYLLSRLHRATRTPARASSKGQLPLDFSRGGAMVINAGATCLRRACGGAREMRLESSSQRHESHVVTIAGPRIDPQL